MKAEQYPELVWTPEMIARFWDWQAGTPEVYFTYQFGAEIARTLAPWFAGRRRILDYGCGVGYLIPHLCRHAAEVHAADTSEVSVAEVNRRLGHLERFRGASTIRALAERGETFDVVLVIEVIEHLYDDALAALFADVRARLAPGGIAIFSTPNNEDRSRNMILCPESGKLFHRWQHVRSWSAESLERSLQQAGFVPEAMIETDMSRPRVSSPGMALRAFTRRMLHGPAGKPHLVAVAQRSAAS